MKGFSKLGVRGLGWLLVMACSCLSLSNARAEGCDDLNHNSEWQEGVAKLNAAYKAQNWDGALKESRLLQEICEQSPALNYSIAHIYKSKNDKEKYLLYLQKATEQTEQFSVDRNLLDIMWAEKYIAAHPEADPETIRKREAEIVKQQSEIETIGRTLVDRDYEIKSLQKDLAVSRHSLEDNHLLYQKLMWSGIGIGIGGLAFAGAGAGMVVVTDTATFKVYKNKNATYKENSIHSLGWAFVGVGSTLVISGAVIAGIFGYKYRQSSDHLDIAFELSPTKSSVMISF